MKKLFYLTTFLLTGMLYAQHISTSGNQTNGDIYHMGGNVGIGIDIPQDKLHLNGNMRVPFSWTLSEEDYHRPIINTGWVSDVGDFISIKHGGNNTENNTSGLRISNGFGLEYGINNFNSTLFRITNMGNVGIGTTNPQGKLDINGSLKFLKGAERLAWGYKHVGSTDHRSYLTPRLADDSNWDWGQEFGYHNYHRAWYFDGKVGIGTMNPDSKLTVAGDIHSREVRVTVTAGADFVFEEDYNLKPLEEVAHYIKANKHLPEIPSEKQMLQDGLHLGEMNIKLLQKIEELTLYTIEQDKTLKQQKQSFETQLSQQEKLIEKLIKRIETLENK